MWFPQKELHAEPVLEPLPPARKFSGEATGHGNGNDCARMIQRAAEAGRILMVGHILRFETKYVLLKQEADSARVGNIVSMRTPAATAQARFSTAMDVRIRPLRTALMTLT